ncbi:MAG: hypothetical protein KDB13_07010, partial [Microthrixaceae bacterium]|nr:hypothetical protein [Microthrixaceae bacterium]
GELGDNTAALRDSIRGDELLRAALSADDVQGVVIGHTRWASIGIVSEPNAHPQSSDELGTSGDGGGPLATAVLNGDVDNYAELSEAEALVLPPEVTCD